MAQIREVFEAPETELVGGLNDLKSVTGDRLLGQRILRLAFTLPGDIVHRPELGAGLQEFQGKPPTAEILRRLRFRFETLLDSLEYVLGYSFAVEASPVTNNARIIDIRVQTDNGELVIEEVDLGNS